MTGPTEGILFSFVFLAVAVGAYFLFEKGRTPPRGDVEGGREGRYA